MNRFLGKARLLAVWVLLLLPLESMAQLFTVKGRVLTDVPDEPACFAVVSILNHDIHAVCDMDGFFVLRNVPAGPHLLQVECLGFAMLKQAVVAGKDEGELLLRLQSESLQLAESHVMARRNPRGKVLVGSPALEYIQPTSLQDVLLLLPGNLHMDNNLTRFSPISSRQVGSDANTALGMGISIDGAPISSDGFRSQFIGITEGSSYNYDNEIDRRTSMNRGTDMRLLSTDHIQRVEFTRGISSARYGNLSSGMISIFSKQGVTPLRVRMKSDLKNKLVYIGKGWRLGEKAGTLHAGADFLHSVSDAREQMDKFTRATAQFYYKNHVKLGDYKLDLDGRLSQTVTVSRMKKDELTYEYDETYRADYSRTSLMLKGNMTLGLRWIDQLEMMLSADCTTDRITRHKMVLSGSGPMNVPLAHERGEHEGLYLPGRYYSDFYVDNLPVNFDAQLNAVSRFSMTSHTVVNLHYGVHHTLVKNWGDGVVVSDEQRPPFPYDNTYMRPRPNHAIPALNTTAAYVQGDWITEIDCHTLLLSLGVRASVLTGLPSDYLLRGKVLADPRVNLSYTVGRRVRHTLRVGIGTESKTPTLDYLYPDKLYKDFYMLNGYTNDPRYRHLITWTDIFDVSNSSLRANRGRKIEAGWDLAFADANLSLTAFSELSDSGFAYFRQYRPLTYDLYSTLRPGVEIEGRRPEKSDYIAEKYTLFTPYNRVSNSQKVVKRGVEYRLILPKFDPLMTSVEINGAWYLTDYASSLPLHYYPAVKIGGREYPYVTIFDNGACRRYARLNTNFWFNTHIPRFRLFLTNFFQVVWLDTSRYMDNREYIPQAYFGADGRVLPVDDRIRALIAADDATFRYFRRTVLPVDYARNEKPISLLWNLKATKEFGKGTKLSFFANGLLDINPKYLSGRKTTQRDWNDPFFGLEIFFNL